ncbi:MAG: TonB-dependent receptor [Novosphingobium sp.]
MDRQLNVNVAGYYYRYNDLQVGARTPAVQGVPRVTTVNAASARTYGIDFDAAYRPAGIEGLSLNGSIVWNKAKYLKFTNAPCYGGQLISDGCNQIFNPAANSFTAQDLSGTPMVRAPEWQLTFGFDYEIPVGDGYRLKFSNSNQYSSSFATALAANRPGRDNYQDKFAKVDLSLAFIAPDDRWEVALIGKNVTDKVTAGNCNVSNYAGGAVFPNPYGGTTRGPAGFDEVGCFAEPGREIWMRVTFRPAG